VIQLSGIECKFYTSENQTLSANIDDIEKELPYDIQRLTNNAEDFEWVANINKFPTNADFQQAIIKLKNEGKLNSSNNAFDAWKTQTGSTDTFEKFIQSRFKVCCN
jgi:glycyl-tRNA synthetase alpha subunit